MSDRTDCTSDLAIAVIGLDGRFPGARSPSELWANLRAGRESLTRFSRGELLAEGFSPHLLDSPEYVPVRGMLEDADRFDGHFFGYTPRECELTDPQHRVFLECSWKALEDAGCNPERIEGRVGVFAGARASEYWMKNLAPSDAVMSAAGTLTVKVGNDKDFLAARVAYKLGLTGPAVTVQTACSTSLVAVHLGCQSLIGGDSDVVLAGGIALSVPLCGGYRFELGGILSADGHCRPFDAEATGTVGGSGCGVVVLKRLADALRDGDAIRAVIKGSAINNDGGQKVGFTAPSLVRQAEVIRAALAAAGVSAESIQYVEAHGTGTKLGDPIEVAALSKAFRAGGVTRRGCCALGSVKSNIGHLDAAAGVASLIKVVLSLEHGELPPSLHYRRANPELDLDSTPFYVQTKLTDWPSPPRGGRRRAGVSSFGMGGTNAHVVVEEAPPVAERPRSEAPDRWRVISYSAKTPSALEERRLSLLGYLEEHEDVDLGDVAFTLREGRQEMVEREAVVARDVAQAVRRLDASSRLRGTVPSDGTDRPVAFMFGGVGEQYEGMCRSPYAAWAPFRTALDRMSALVRASSGLDVGAALLLAAGSPSTDRPEQPTVEHHSDHFRHLVSGISHSGPLYAPELVQPALFVMEYALAELWSWFGVRTSGMIGHSLGEYVAATLSGVFDLEDALELVTIRGRLMQSMEPGAMLAVPLAVGEVEADLPEALSIAAINAPTMCVVGGAREAIECYERAQASRGIAVRRLRTSHAFHTPAMGPAAEALGAHVRGLRLNEPKVPWISNVTGTWIRSEEATSAEYWMRHLLEPVRFSEGLATLVSDSSPVLLEIGPGETLAALARLLVPEEVPVVTTLGHRVDERGAEETVLTAAAKLWAQGARVEWPSLANEAPPPRRLHLPTYPFQRTRYWIAPPKAPTAPRRDGSSTEANESPRTEATSKGTTDATQSLTVLSGTRRTDPTETESQLARIWGRLLGTAEPGLDADFFEMGGHSLLATQLIALIQETMGSDVSLADVFACRTIRTLAELIVTPAETNRHVPLNARHDSALPTASEGAVEG